MPVAASKSLRQHLYVLCNVWPRVQNIPFTWDVMIKRNAELLAFEKLQRPNIWHFYLKSDTVLVFTLNMISVNLFSTLIKPAGVVCDIIGVTFATRYEVRILHLWSSPQKYVASSSAAGVHSCFDWLGGLDDCTLPTVRRKKTTLTGHFYTCWSPTWSHFVVGRPPVPQPWVVEGCVGHPSMYITAKLIP